MTKYTWILKKKEKNEQKEIMQFSSKRRLDELELFLFKVSENFD